MTKRQGEAQAERLGKAYAAEKPRLLARLRRAGRTLEEAEDLVHETFVEALGRLPLLEKVRNLGAWLNVASTRRAIDLWRRDGLRRSKGEADVPEETLSEIIAATGFDPHDAYVRSALAGALDDALKALPREQRDVVEAQVFGGLTFREIAERTGEKIDTLTARKRYAVGKLARALRGWIED